MKTPKRIPPFALGLGLGVILISAAAILSTCEKAKPPPDRNYELTTQDVNRDVTLRETRLADGTPCAIVLSVGPSPGVAITCAWERPIVKDPR